MLVGVVLQAVRPRLTSEQARRVDKGGMAVVRMSVPGC